MTLRMATSNICYIWLQADQRSQALVRLLHLLAGCHRIRHPTRLPQWLAGAGSIVIMTSRDRRVLQLAGCQRVERVDVLEPDWAWHMFSSHVDVSSIPSSVDQPTISQVVKLCGGLPLSLKVRLVLLSTSTLLPVSRAVNVI